MRVSQRQYRLALSLNEFDYCEDYDFNDHDRAAIISLENKGIAEKISFEGVEIWVLTVFGYSLMPETKLCRSTNKTQGCKKSKPIGKFHSSKSKLGNTCRDCIGIYRRNKYKTKNVISNMSTMVW